jgi:hypothetical protein
MTSTVGINSKKKRPGRRERQLRRALLTEQSELVLTKDQSTMTERDNQLTERPDSPLDVIEYLVNQQRALLRANSQTKIKQVSQP